MRGTWDDFTDKYGFEDGRRVGDEDFKARAYLVDMLNSLPEFHDRRAIAYNGVDAHNPCRIIILPKVEGASDEELIEKWLAYEISQVDLPLGKDWCISELVEDAYDEVEYDVEEVAVATRESVKFVVPRSQAYDDEYTFAVVTAQVEEDLRDGRTFMQRLVKAVTEWVKTTDEGRAAWKCSSEDFNVGDLVHYVGDPSLDTILTRNGVYNLRVQVFSEDYPSGWQFDDVLVDL